MKFLAIVVAGAAVLAAAPALAQQPPRAAPQPPGATTAPPPRDPVFLGVGARRCSEWTADRAGASRGLAGLIWFEGFATGFNVTGLEPSRNATEGLNIDQLAAQMDMYCRQDPTQLIGLAAMRTLGDLVRRKGHDPQAMTVTPALPRLPAQPAAPAR